MMKEHKILVIGACGQIGTELTAALREKYGRYNVIAADKKITADILLDVMDLEELNNVVRECGVTQVYHLAAMLSANGEQNADMAWKLNVGGLLNVLKVAKERELDKIFWPSSIAVFGQCAPKYNCHQFARMEPTTVYGISKRAGEYWCHYYAEKYQVDVRSLRYPGLISWKATPGGGTTDYAVDIFHAALESKPYTCYLSEDNCLPMMYMDDAVRATLELMETPREKIGTRLSYNLAGVSFAPCDLAAMIRKYVPDFRIQYEPDYRDVIAKSWPATISDKEARAEWGWAHEYNIDRIVREMLVKLALHKKIELPEETRQQLDYPDFPADHEVFSYC